ncbi:MAG: peroxiredoxin [Proteobacteria bacterium]|jgi:peroxiredoxin Q/BCP|nr:peroxiredoxin [Pseudomonadota bacterium]
MAKVALGRKLPTFSVPTTAGTFRPGDALGSKLVVYFYPRDNTPGCTREGEAFRDLHAQFRRAGVVILGVSTDSLASHGKFKAKMKFPFELGSDEDHRLAELFGTWTEKNMYGRKLMGIERSTFLVDAAGVLRQEWRKVKVDGHAEAVLAAARAL